MTLGWYEGQDADGKPSVSHVCLHRLRHAEMAPRNSASLLELFSDGGRVAHPRHLSTPKTHVNATGAALGISKVPEWIRHPPNGVRS